MNSGCSLSTHSGSHVVALRPRPAPPTTRPCGPSVERRRPVALEHDHLLHASACRGAASPRSSERHHRALAPAAVGGEQHLRAGVVHAVAQRLGGEPAEHHRVHRADARARQHRHRRLGHHRQVDAHPVALLHAQRLAARWRTGPPARAARRRSAAAVARLALEEERDLVPARSAGAGPGSCRRGWCGPRRTSARAAASSRAPSGRAPSSGAPRARARPSRPPGRFAPPRTACGSPPGSGCARASRTPPAEGRRGSPCRTEWMLVRRTLRLEPWLLHESGRPSAECSRVHFDTRAEPPRGIVGRSPTASRQQLAAGAGLEAGHALVASVNSTVDPVF